MKAIAYAPLDSTVNKTNTVAVQVQISEMAWRVRLEALRPARKGHDVIGQARCQYEHAGRCTKRNGNALVLVDHRPLPILNE